MTRQATRAARILEASIVPIVFLTLFCAALQPIIEDDVWWHLRAGGDIVHGAGIPRVDTYSFTAAGRPYVDLHWLFQVAAYLAHRATGLTGLILLKCALLMATFGIVYRLARRGAPQALAATLTGVGVILASERFLVRPEIATFLLLAATLWLLRRHTEGSQRAWMVLPAVTLVWVNVEGLFVLGLVALAAYIASRPTDRKLWLAAALSIPAALANPYFVTGALHPFVLFTRISGSMAIYSATIAEFVGPFAAGVAHPSIALFPYFLALIVVALALYGRRPPVHELVLMAAFLYLGLRARRNLALLAIVAVPIVARWIAEGWETGWIRPLVARVSTRVRQTGPAFASFAVCIAFLGYDLCLVNGMTYESIGTNRSFGVGIAEGAAPVEAVAFLKEHRIDGPLFNTFSSGGYVAYADPGLKVFFDGRLEVHTAESYTDYLYLLRGGEAWRRADERYRFRTLLMNFTEAPQLTMERLQDPGWAPVEVASSTVVFVRQDPGNRELIDRYRLTPEHLQERFPILRPEDLTTLPVVEQDSLARRLFRREPVPWDQLFLGTFFDFIRNPELAAAQYVRAIRRAPHALTPRVLLAVALGDMGASDDARRVLAAAAPLARTRAQRETLESARANLPANGGR